MAFPTVKLMHSSTYTCIDFSREQITKRFFSLLPLALLHSIHRTTTLDTNSTTTLDALTHP
jgi:hypothetical protein